MGKIKLPKSLTRLLFPKKKRAAISTADGGSETARRRDGGDFGATGESGGPGEGAEEKGGAGDASRDGEGGEDGADGEPPYEDSRDATARKEAHEDSVGLRSSALDSPGDGARRSLLPPVGFGFGEGDGDGDGSFALDGDGAAPREEGVVKHHKDGGKGADAADSNGGEKSANTPQGSKVESESDAVEIEPNATEPNGSLVKDSITNQLSPDRPVEENGSSADQFASFDTQFSPNAKINTDNTPNAQNNYNPTNAWDPSEILPVVSPHSSPTINPSAERARRKAIARQKRILSKCEERLNALSGAADATLESSNNFAGGRNPVGRRVRNKEKAGSVRSSDGNDGKKTVASKTSEEEEEKLFSTIVFYESPNPTAEETDLFSKGSPPPPPSFAAGSPGATSVDRDGFPLLQTSAARTTSSNPQTASGDPTGSNPTPFFVLLLDPKSRIFELVEIDDAPPSRSLGDVLREIREKCTDERLERMRYGGLVRVEDKVEFSEADAPVFGDAPNSGGDGGTSMQRRHCIRENDVLVAILEGSTGFQMCKISKPILKNAKFRDMMRRRRGKKKPPRRIVEIGKASEIEAEPTEREKKEKYDILCKKLENLSKKLHQVDEEILTGAVTLRDRNPAPAELAADAAGEASGGESAAQSYRMSPKMVATELAHHIEDIFADHDVEILAVDADDGEESDDGTFVSARSHRSQKSAKSLLAKEAAPSKRRRRRKVANLFESDDDNALALQIEAMAVQADAAFENRRGKKKRQPTPEPEEDIYEIPNLEGEAHGEEEEGAVANAVVPEGMGSSYILDAMKSLTRGSTVVDVSNCSAEQKEAFSRNFLNTSTSMVTTMVAATHGRVNEVHVLQYLGCTIVCIAANFVQQMRAKQPYAAPPVNPRFEARHIFQSAMFLAFMVNGQRYLAKVTKK